jgi:iron only hydrogenase large subunit-like protein
MVACGKMLKNKYKDAMVVFIGPCTTKKAEIRKKNLKDSIDYVMTFEEAAALLGDMILILKNGVDEIKGAMIQAKQNRLEGNFIEGMMCQGRCIGGAGKYYINKKI